MRIEEWCRSRLGEFLLFVLAVSLFALSHPNPLLPRGCALLAYGALAPLFLLVRWASGFAVVFWGGAYGAFSYGAFSYWLFVFHPVALCVVAGFSALFLAALCLALKAGGAFWQRRALLVQCLVWLGYEYAKTLGFLGFPYGVMGYSQWRVLPLIQVASVFGVWAVSALVVFPSAWLASVLGQWVEESERDARAFLSAAYSHWVSALVWVGLCGFCVCAAKAGWWPDCTAHTRAKVALVQPNSDPRRGGIESYRADFSTLTYLSDWALERYPDVDLVVWPETAFVPRIDWHYRYRHEQQSFQLVCDLLDYVNAKNCPFVIGSDDAYKRRTKEGDWERVDYNAALLFIPGVNVLPPSPQRYHKIKLVPFTEYFPYKRVFPWFYNFLEKQDARFWAQGSEFVVFEARGLKFSVPICFEDAFGYITREFCARGASLLVNISNDSWAKSLSCQYQHLSMAVFRAIENRRALVRASTSGQTVAIAPDGRILDELQPFAPGVLVADVPIVTCACGGYRYWGDALGVFFCVASLFILIAGGARHMLRCRRGGWR
ncbi:apolipoprotein N-acyltransferase [Treponema paraluiscuniculi Cuniculi A]|uniref:Apolipoprotein N-acyltransferase n=2 Tax=Treponema paraluiscuniculi TaxID=53435 RepID=F7XS80_TREPU|nr:apolipoprotein N-acyltransferase [Treponema paraluiscuniculi]AEH40203.1 apolipoprotein N-acyltransferase [Treponema paraluiscuniculi Cuniculi A]WKC72137.1 apolipoprotein N-acyltransferase [Treponema paraluiscuniculi]